MNGISPTIILIILIFGMSKASAEPKPTEMAFVTLMKQMLTAFHFLGIIF